MCGREIPTGVDVDEALRLAVLLRDKLQSGQAWASEFEVNVESIETLAALITLLRGQDSAYPADALKTSAAIFDFLTALRWPQGFFSEREELLSRCAFLCWAYSSRAGTPSQERYWSRRHAAAARLTSAFEALRASLSAGASTQEARSLVHVNDPEWVLCLCEALREKIDDRPIDVLQMSEQGYNALADLEESGHSPVDRDLFLGELACLSGAACRFLGHRDQARRWFDRAEASFALIHNSAAHQVRVAYQRMAVYVEERQFDLVTELVSRWLEVATGLDLTEETLKLNFLQAVALKETEQLNEAKEAFKRICDEASSLGYETIFAIASQNLFQIHAFLGETAEAEREYEIAAEIFRKLDARLGLAKLQLGGGYLLREQGKLLESISAFREAQRQFSAIGINTDVAATHLVLAELFLDNGETSQAELEIRAALPIIDNLKLLPEAMAALALLRESLRRRQIDQQALRDLRSHFPNPKD
jgi:tetratricopeptide (TPR) repeat protein